MDTLTVGETTYTKRPYTTRPGETPRHGWLRPVPGASSATGQSEVGAEAKALLDRIEALETAQHLDRPSIIGREAHKADELTRRIRSHLHRIFDATDVRSTRRGATFDILQPSGHVFTVAVTLDRLDPDLATEEA